MRQLCPHCFHSIELADSVAGREAACPDCGKSFHVPETYTPNVDPAAAHHNLPPQEPLPPLVITPSEPNSPSKPNEPIPPPPPGVKLEALAGTAAAIYAIQNFASGKPNDQQRDEGPMSSRTLHLSPRILEPIPVACFSVILLLTFVSWVGCMPGGHRAYTQSPWEALFGWFATDHFAEDVLQQEAGLNERIFSNVILLLPYLLGLLLATAIAWADRFVHDSFPRSSPFLEMIARYWPMRLRIMLALSLGLIALILVQTRVGFSLESAVHARVNEKFAPQFEKAETSAAKEKLQILEAQELSKFELRPTIWQSIAIRTHWLAALALVGRWWLGTRGDKPLPRLSVSW